MHIWEPCEVACDETDEERVLDARAQANYEQIERWAEACNRFCMVALCLAVVWFGWMAHRAGTAYWLTMLRGLFLG